MTNIVHSQMLSRLENVCWGSDLTLCVNAWEMVSSASRLRSTSSGENLVQTFLARQFFGSDSKFVLYRAITDSGIPSKQFDKQQVLVDMYCQAYSATAKPILPLPSLFSIYATAEPILFRFLAGLENEHLCQNYG